MLEHLALFGYVGALAFAFLYGGFRLTGVAYWVMGFLLLGFAFQTGHIFEKWAESGIIPATTLSDLCSAMAWMLVFLYLAMYWKLQNTIMTFFLMPLVTTSFLLSSALPTGKLEVKPFFYTPWFVTHIVLLVMGMGFFFLSFLYATVYIMQDHRLRKQHAPPRLALPSLQEAQKLATLFLLLGYPPFTLGIMSSIIYGVRYGNSKDWHPGLMEAASLIAWLVLGVAIYGWVSSRVRPRKRSWMIVAGAALSVLIVLGILWH